MTDEEKIRNCIELIWDYEEVYDDDDLINFQNKELGTYTQYDNILNKLTKYTQLEKENTELKEKLSYLEDNLRVARKDRKNLQLKVGKGLKEFIKDCPYSALKLYANGYYVEQLTKAKEIIKDYMIISSNVTVCSVPEENRCINVLKLNKQAEQFLKELEK